MNSKGALNIMLDRETLLQDITDPKLRKDVSQVLDDFDKVSKATEEMVEEVLTEARNSDKISKADREAIAKEASRRMEAFFKGTVLIGYIDLRRQVKATQREISALRKDIDKLSKQMATKDQLDATERKLDSKIQLGLRGQSGSNRKKEMIEFYDTVDETASNIQKVMKHLGIK